MRRSYTINEDRQPTAAVVKSLLAAEDETRRWEQAQLVRNLTDADGTLWSIVIARQEGYLSGNLSKSFGLKVDISLRFLATKENLIAARVYSADEDERLLEMIGEHEIPIEIRAFHLESADIAGLERDMKGRLDELVAGFSQYSLKSLKKKNVERWIEQHKGFGMG